MNALALLMKAKKGDLGPDEIEEALAAIGIEAQMGEVSAKDYEAVFTKVADATSLPGAALMRLTLKMKVGQFEGLVVLVPNRDHELSGPEITLDMVRL